MFMESKVKVTSKGKWHLGAVIGSEGFKVSHTQLLLVVSKGNFKHFMWTIPYLGDFLKPLEIVIRFIFILAMIGRHLCSDNDRILHSFSSEVWMNSNSTVP